MTTQTARVEPATQASRRDPFISVAVATLVPSTMLGVSLYMRDDNRLFKLYRDAGYPFGEDELHRLRNSDVSQLYVASRDYEGYQEYVRENMPRILHDESLPTTQRFDTLNVVVRDIMAEQFQRGNVDAMVEQTGSVAEWTVDIISHADAMAAELCDVLYHDYHTFTHSANVAFYCVMLAQAFGLEDRGELEAIAVGGLLHDVGKLDVPDAYLRKPGKLTDAEFRAIKRHPTTGLMKLGHRTDLSLGQLMMVYQHHERMDGKGYPVGVVRDEIHEWGRLCNVVDVYEALTSDRPYRSAYSPEEAFEIMDRQCGTAFDEGLLKCWKSTILNK